MYKMHQRHTLYNGSMLAQGNEEYGAFGGKWEPVQSGSPTDFDLTIKAFNKYYQKSQ